MEKRILGTVCGFRPHPCNVEENEGDSDSNQQQLGRGHCICLIAMFVSDSCADTYGG
jgi:hypothetical protein